jgi:hypothetical protein
MEGSLVASKMVPLEAGGKPGLDFLSCPLVFSPEAGKASL